MERLLGWVILFAIVWSIFAFFDIPSSSDTLKVYQLGETGDRTGSKGQLLPKRISRGVTEYRIVGDKVTWKYGDGSVSSYEGCSIFDVENWSCTFRDNSATFGARSGKYFSISNTQKFPHLLEYKEPETVSRFSYILNSCEWDLADDKVWGFLGCALSPFVE